MNGPALERTDATPGHWLRGRRAALVISIGLTLLAAPPRLVNLDRLSFHSDEETTAFPARSLAEGEGAEMPSGMSYRRALPLTWLNAAAARLLGIDREAPYRLPTAIFGILTVPLFFLFGRRFFGTPTALTAALLLGLSEWHLAFSRQARMYVPLLFFFVAATYAIWAWEDRGRWKDLLAAAILTAAAIPFHALAILLALVAAVPLAFPGRVKVAPHWIIAFGVITGLASRAYNKWVLGAAYSYGPPPLAQTASGAERVHTLAAIPTVWAVGLGLLGLGLGVWAARRSRQGRAIPEGWTVRLGRYAAAALAGAFACLGQIYAAGLALLVFLIPHPLGRRDLLKRAGPPLVPALLIALAWVGALMIAWGAKPAAKAVLGFPLLFPIELARQTLPLTLVFGGICVWLTLTRYRSEQLWLRSCVLTMLLMLAILGAQAPFTAPRFIFPVYPFMLLAIAAAMIRGLKATGARFGAGGAPVVTAAAALIAASGLLGAHGVPQTVRVAGLEHGEPINAAIHMNPFQPDHEAPGRFLRATRQPGDVIIAEDPLQQTWYAGPVDFWFRSYSDSRIFLHEAPDGRLRDIYTNSALIQYRSRLDSLLQSAKGRVWLVTSGETYDFRSYYLEAWQRAWLDSLEAAREPAFSGRDSRTRVYCLTCTADVDAVK